MSLSDVQIKHLRKLGHEKKPIILVGGNGISDGVVNETDLSLEHHELLKVKVKVGDRDLRDEMIAELVSRTQSQLVQRIGNIALLYRPAKEPKLVLPKS